MKKLRILLVVLTVALVGLLTACDNTDELLDTAEADLIANYADSIGSDAYEVTDDLNLITSVGDATISWSSSNTDVISNTGVVTRQQDDTNVTLTATITINETDKEVEFDVVVPMIPAADQVDTAKAALIAHYAATIGDDNYDVSDDLSLVTTIEGVSVSWASNDEAIVATDGTVNRPSYTDADGAEGLTVQLTATLTKGDASDTVNFYAYVLTLDKTTSETVNEVFDIVVTFPANEGITGAEEWLGTVDELEAFLPSYTYEDETYAISWSSDMPANLDIVDGEGVVVRPAAGEDDVTVTVTASITVGSDTFTREYQFKVLAYEAPTLVDSIAAISDAASGDYVQVNGVTVIAIVGTNAFLSDGTNMIYVYDSSFGDNVEVGSVYDVAGVFSPYYGIPELVSDTGLPLVATPSDEVAASLEGSTSTISDLLDGRTPPSDLNFMVFEYVQLRVKVVVDAQDTNSGSNYNTYLVPVDYTGDSVITNVGTDGKATEYATDDVLLVYYGSPNKDDVAALDGKEITIDVLLFGYRSDRNIWYTYFFGDSDDITVHLTDQQSVDAAQENLPGMFDEVFYEGDTLDLPASLYDTTITYASSDDTVINPTTGAVAIPASGQVDVTLTATIAKGDITPVEVQIVITVGVPANSDISAARAEDAGTVVVVTGVVTAAEYQNTYFIQDATGGLAIYSYDSDVEAFLQANYGNEVQILGSMTSHRDMVQLSPDSDFLTVVNDVDAVMPTAVNLDAMDLTAEALLPYQGQLVEISDLYVSEVSSDSYGNTYITFVRLADGAELDMKQDSRVTLSTEAQALLDSVVEGSYVTVTNPLAWSNDPYLYFTDTTGITFDTLSDAAAVAAVAAMLPEGFVFDDPIEEDMALSLSSEELGVTIAWASDDETVIGLNGDVVVPTDGSQVMVTLTATLTKGVETEEVVIEIYVGQTPPLTISAARAVTDDEEVFYIHGVITSAEHNGDWFIQDDTAGLNIYIKYNRDDVSDFRTFLNDNYGNEVRLEGTLGSYKDEVYLVPTTIDRQSVVNSTDAVMPDAMNIDAVELTESGLMDYQGQLVELTGLYVAEVNIDSHDNVKATLVDLEDGNSILLDYSSYTDLSTEAAADLATIVEGKLIDIVSPLGWRGYLEVYFTESTVFTLSDVTTDADKAAIDAMEIDIETSFTAAGTITLPATSTYGTIAWASDNTLIDASTGAVTLPESGSVDVVLTATVTVGAETKDAMFTVTVTKPAEGEMTYTETFSNLGLSGTSYSEGSFVGDNGITWAYTESRGDFTLDGQAIMLDKDGDGASLSATISGGISSFSVEFFDAYSGAAQVEVYINGTLVGTSISHDGDADDTPVLFEITALNITGDFTIEILSGASQMVIDNLTWTDNSVA